MMSSTSPRRMRLEVVDASWAAKFAEESARLASAVGVTVDRIEHVGSTAVPGILGKPILDIGMLVGGRDAFDAISAALVDLGYDDRGRYGDDPLRHYFTRDEEGRRLVQLHVWTRGGTAWAETLAFRDLLRRRPDLRAAYGEEKRRAAEATGWVKNAYSIEKAPFVERMLEAEGIR